MCDYHFWYVEINKPPLQSDSLVFVIFHLHIKFTYLHTYFTVHVLLSGSESEHLNFYLHMMYTLIMLFCLYLEE